MPYLLHLGAKALGSMDRLTEIGFEMAGRWILVDGDIEPELIQFATDRNVLYAFAAGGKVVYVGKTTTEFRRRMRGYVRPAESQTTNVRNNARIREILESGREVQIFALPDPGLLRYGVFHLNLAAGLEDDVIHQLDPAWNGKRTRLGGLGHSSAKSEALRRKEADTPRREAVRDREATRSGPVRTRFSVTLHPTYYHQGFFNVVVEHDHLIGRAEGPIDIYLGDAEEPILGTIDRHTNQNGTPRILGRTAMRDWFRQNAQEMGSVMVAVMSPTAMRITLQ